MTHTQALRDADRRRRDAMIAGEPDTLAALLDDELVWIHSSGKQDDKTSFLGKIAAGGVVYLELEVSDDSVTDCGDVLVHRGNLFGRASVGGRDKALRNRFLSVWRRSGDVPQLLFWQSTGY